MLKMRFFIGTWHERAKHVCRSESREILAQHSMPKGRVPSVALFFQRALLALSSQKLVLFLVYYCTFSLIGIEAVGSATMEHSHGAQKSHYFCPMHPHIKNDKPSTCPICNMDLIEAPAKADKKKVSKKEMPLKISDDGNEGQKWVTVYTCPMHPQVKSQGPGTCPICKMDLVKSEGGETLSTIPRKELPSQRAAVAISSERRQLIGVKLGTVDRKILYKRIRAPGQVAFDPELYTAQREYQQALRQRERVKDSPLSSVKKNVSRMVQSARIRLRVLGLSQGQIQSIGPNEKLSENLLLSKESGKIWIYAEVFEMDLRNIKKGQTVDISSRYLDGKTIKGMVISTDELISPKTRTAKVRIQVEDPQIKLRPQSFVDVRINVPQGEHLAVAQDAIMDTGEETFVYVNLGEGKISPRKVMVAFHAGKEAAIAMGLEEGEEIVLGANFLVDSESRLKRVFQQFDPNFE